MSISFSGVIGSANADWQLGLKGADDLRSDGESLFANFSIVLHSLSDGNPETLSENEKLNISIGNLDRPLKINFLQKNFFLKQLIMDNKI